MKKQTSFNVTYNPWFIIPFLAWMTIGAVLFIFYTKEELFSAVNTRNNPFLDTFMHSVTELGDRTAILIILAGLLIFPQLRTWWFVLTLVLCNLVPAFIVQMIKELVQEPRPMKVFEGETWIHIAENWKRLEERSFPSGHTAGAFSLFCFLSLLLPKKFAPFGLLFFLIALTVGYSRMYLAAHFYRDVYVGSLLGTMVTLAIYLSIRQIHGRINSVEKPAHPDDEAAPQP